MSYIGISTLQPNASASTYALTAGLSARISAIEQQAGQTDELASTYITSGSGISLPEGEHLTITEGNLDIVGADSEVKQDVKSVLTVVTDSWSLQTDPVASAAIYLPDGTISQVAVTSLTTETPESILQPVLEDAVAVSTLLSTLSSSTSPNTTGSSLRVGNIGDSTTHYMGEWISVLTNAVTNVGDTIFRTFIDGTTPSEVMRLTSDNRVIITGELLVNGPLTVQNATAFDTGAAYMTLLNDNLADTQTSGILTQYKEGMFDYVSGWLRYPGTDRWYLVKDVDETTLTTSTNASTLPRGDMSLAALVCTSITASGQVVTTANFQGPRFFASTNGTAADPSHTFLGMANSGMYGPATNVLGFVTQSTDRLTIQASESKFTTPLTAVGMLTASGGLTVTGTATANGLIQANAGITVASGQTLTTSAATATLGTTTTTDLTSSALITANAGITANGLILANAGVTVPAGQILNTSAGTATLGTATTTTLTSSGLIQANAGLTVAAGQTLTTTGGTTTLGTTTTGTLTASGALTANAALHANGIINANAGITVPSGQTLTTTAGTATLGATTTTTLAASGLIQANAGLTVPAGQTLTTTGGTTTLGTTTTAALTTSGLITANAGITATGIINANAGLTVPSGQTLTTTAGTATLGTTTTGALTTSGVLTANAPISANGLINANAGITVPAGQTLTTTAGTATLGATSTTTLLANGMITANSGLTATGSITANGGINATGLIQAGAGLTVPSGQTLTTTAGTATLGTTTTGTLQSSGLITASAGITANGIINANAGLTVASGQTLTTTGATTTLGATTTGTLQTNGLLTAATGLTANGMINANAGLTVPSGQTLTTSAGTATLGTTTTTTLTSSGLILANAGLTVPSGQTLTTSAGTATLGTTTTTTLTSSGLIQANAGLTVSAGQTLTTTGGTATLGTTTTGTLTASGAITANAGITVPSGQTLTTTAGTATLGTTTTTTLTSSGLIQANAGLTVPAGQTLTTTSGTATLGTTTTGTLTSSGLITANAGITVPSGQTLTTTAGTTNLGTTTITAATLANGTGAAPSLNFNGGNTTGLYYTTISAVPALGFSSNAVSRAKLYVNGFRMGMRGTPSLPAYSFEDTLTGSAPEQAGMWYDDDDGNGFQNVGIGSSGSISEALTVNSQGLVTMKYSQYAPTGSATVPTISTQGNATSGLFLSGTDSAFTVSGTERVRWTGTEQTMTGIDLNMNTNDILAVANLSSTSNISVNVNATENMRFTSGQVQCHKTFSMENQNIINAGTLDATATTVTTLSASGLITASGGVTVPTGQTLTTTAGTATLGPTTTTTLTASGLITASNGVTIAGAPLFTTNGSAANPAHSFTNVQDMGAYRSSSTVYGIATEGKASLTVSQTETKCTGRMIVVDYLTVEDLDGSANNPSVRIGTSNDLGLYRNGDSLRAVTLDTTRFIFGTTANTNQTNLDLDMNNNNLLGRKRYLVHWRGGGTIGYTFAATDDASAITTDTAAGAAGSPNLYSKFNITGTDFLNENMTRFAQGGTSRGWLNTSSETKYFHATFRSGLISTTGIPANAIVYVAFIRVDSSLVDATILANSQRVVGTITGAGGQITDAEIETSCSFSLAAGEGIRFGFGVSNPDADSDVSMASGGQFQCHEI